MIKRIPEGHFLVCYDYGMGGLWWLVKAASADEIRIRSPDLTIVEVIPEWMANDAYVPKTVDLHDPDDETFRALIEDR